MFTNYGQLAVDMFPVQQFGLAERYPKLTRLQTEVADLDARRLEAERDLVALRQGVGAAREKDAEAAAKAIRAGKDMLEGKHEVAAEAKVREAERRLKALEGATAAAAQDLAAEQRGHAHALTDDLAKARAQTAKRVSEQAASLLGDYATFVDSAGVMKRFAPPPPSPDESRPAQKTTFVVAAPRATPGLSRGDIEAVLSHLSRLADA